MYVLCLWCKCVFLCGWLCNVVWFAFVCFLCARVVVCVVCELLCGVVSLCV